MSKFRTEPLNSSGSSDNCTIGMDIKREKIYRIRTYVKFECESSFGMEFHESFNLMTNIFVSHGIHIHKIAYLLHSTGIIKNPKLCARL